MFGERPYAELSVREVAQAAGVTENLVYHYFTNKETLFLAAFQHADELLAACLPPRDLPMLEQFERAVKGYLDFVEANATVYLNLVHGPAAGEEEVQRVCEQTRKRIADRYLEGLGVKALPVPLTRLAVRGYVGFVEELVLRWLPKRSVPRADIERLMFAAGGATFVAALAMDGAVPQALSVEQFRKAFQRHFSLP
jgi:AcrR family transcriptional regulator